MKDERKKYMRGSGIFDSLDPTTFTPKNKRVRKTPPKIRGSRGRRSMGGQMYAEGGKVYSNIRDMEKACMSPDHNESMKEK